MKTYTAEPEHDFPSTGNYIVRLQILSTCGGALDTIPVHIFSATDIDELGLDDQQVVIFPVPSDDYVTI